MNTALQRVLVAGGGGPLGSALLESLLSVRAFSPVSVLVTQPTRAALHGLRALLWPEGTALPPGDEPVGVIVFDRERHANGRELSFYRPEPAQLPALAAQWRERGVRHLLVVMPHTMASLPDALKRGLANLDEHAVAALGFEHLVFIRTAQAGAHERISHPAQRLAHWMLSQLQLMVPQRDRPVRAQKVAQFAAQLAARLPFSPPGTRVVPPETVWEAAQTDDIAGLAQAWLNGPARAPAPSATEPPARP
jgi:nucleoside-diphosphate-sugar epimerase